MPFSLFCSFLITTEAESFWMDYIFLFIIIYVLIIWRRVSLSAYVGSFLPLTSSRAFVLLDERRWKTDEWWKGHVSSWLDLHTICYRIRLVASALHILQLTHWFCFDWGASYFDSFMNVKEKNMLQIDYRNF